MTSVSNLLVHDTAERQAALRGHNDEKATENLGLPTEARGGMVESRGYVSNSCRFAITFCWWLWQREAYSFPLIHEQNQKALYKCGEINEFVIKCFLPRK